MKLHRSRLSIIKARFPEATGTLKDIIAGGKYANYMPEIDAQFKHESTARKAAAIKRQKRPLPVFECEGPICADINELIKTLHNDHVRDAHLSDSIHGKFEDIAADVEALEKMVGEYALNYQHRARDFDALMTKLETIRKVYVRWTPETLSQNRAAPQG